MEIKKITTTQIFAPSGHKRPDSFDDFIGQQQIKKMLKTAIGSAKKREGNLGHTLFAGPSGFGKTTMAHVIAKQLGVGVKLVTAYAISKPSEIVSLLNSLEQGDVLFIDEIHRLKPTVEEVLYIAMEDFVIDMVMPEGGSVRIPINPFTLIGATTRPEMLSQPMKNRFVYRFHFMDYSFEEKQVIIERYLQQYQLSFSPSLLREMAQKVDSVPREIHNLVIKLRDFFVNH
ncbi:MAG: AAA family ATPase [Candidatus Peribacteria bacterium]|jgi:Holliday junction DNA helicase RuvB|nr:AAA family ATPase [Candidatus Peribacteria bacterium]